jgi:Putative prokaryotic signal transducing protein
MEGGRPCTYSWVMGIISRILGLFVAHADDGAPVRLPSPDELVLLSRPNGEIDAQLLRQMLSSEGIHAMVKNRDAVSAELWVLRRDLRRAREIIGDGDGGGV